MRAQEIERASEVLRARALPIGIGHTISSALQMVCWFVSFK